MKTDDKVHVPIRIDICGCCACEYLYVIAYSRTNATKVGRGACGAQVDHVIGEEVIESITVEINQKRRY